MNRVFLHALFWCLSILSFAIVFRLSPIINVLDYINSVLFHLSIIIGVYLNLWSISIWFKNKKYLLYVIFLIIFIVITVVLNQLTFSHLVDLILPDYYFVSQFNNIEVGILVILYIAITSAMKLSKLWFDLQSMNNRIAETEKEKLNSELRILKAQINPHFLFNSLNVIYSLTLNNDKNTPDVILKLSDILRYVIYDSSNEQVTLKSEIDLLEKYIELQKYRTEELTPISFNYKIEKDIQIAPLLFLTLVENSFKHGIKGGTNNVFVDINLVSDNKKVYFEIVNNKGETKLSNGNSGIGLENIRKRLKLLYPNRHSFIVSENADKFTVNLEIRHED